MTLKLLLGTNNPDKVLEYRSLLCDLPAQLVTLADVGITSKVEETGQTMEDNAILKASAYARESGLVTIADDSGLEVDALGGKPGPLSARYAGEGATDSDRINYLLARLEGVPWEKRTARFRCVIAVATPDGRMELCSGERRGYIGLKPKGDNGFGYDPVFYFPELGKTMAELPMEVKNRLSHRGQAARQVPVALKKLGLL